MTLRWSGRPFRIFLGSSLRWGKGEKRVRCKLPMFGMLGRTRGCSAPVLYCLKMLLTERVNPSASQKFIRCCKSSLPISRTLSSPLSFRLLGLLLRPLLLRAVWLRRLLLPTPFLLHNIKQLRPRHRPVVPLPIVRILDILYVQFRLKMLWFTLISDCTDRRANSLFVRYLNWNTAYGSLTLSQ